MIVALVGDKPYLIPVSNPAYSAAEDFSVYDASSSTCLGSDARARCSSAVSESAEYVVPYELTEPHMPTEYAMPYDAVDATWIQPLDAGGYVVDGSAITGGNIDINYEVIGTFREEGIRSGIYSPVHNNGQCSGCSYFPFGRHSTSDGGDRICSCPPLARHSTCTSEGADGKYGPLERHSTYADGISFPTVVSCDLAAGQDFADFASAGDFSEVEA
jgi:hypothetical protein